MVTRRFLARTPGRTIVRCTLGEELPQPLSHDEPGRTAVAQPGKLTISGRVAQRRSTRLTSGGSLVRTQPCPPAAPRSTRHNVWWTACCPDWFMEQRRTLRKRGVATRTMPQALAEAGRVVSVRVARFGSGTPRGGLGALPSTAQPRREHDHPGPNPTTGPDLSTRAEIRFWLRPRTLGTGTMWPWNSAG